MGVEIGATLEQPPALGAEMDVSVNSGNAANAANASVTTEHSKKGKGKKKKKKKRHDNTSRQME